MITIIAALSQNYVLGMNGKLPWHLPADFAWFKSQTIGKPVVMGRKTFDSLGQKPLPKRMNIIVSRYPQLDGENLIWASSLEYAIKEAEKYGDEVMILGGGDIYSQAMPLANRLYLTEISATYEGDAFFPAFDKSLWMRTILSEHEPEGNQPAFVIAQYDRL